MFDSFLDEDAEFPGDTVTVVAATRDNQYRNVRVEEHCLFGQRRASTKYGGTAVLQLDEAVAMCRRFVHKCRQCSVTGMIKALVCGPGYYTAGLRSRKALPASAPRSVTLRLRSVPQYNNSLSLLYLAVHTAATYTAILRVLFDTTSGGVDAVLAALVPLTALVCHGYMLDSARSGVESETLRCGVTVAAQVWYSAAGHANGHVGVDAVIETLTAPCAYAAWFWLHFYSTVLLQSMPTRFQRRVIP